MSGKKSSILKYVKRKTKEYIYIYIYIYYLKQKLVHDTQSAQHAQSNEHNSYIVTLWRQSNAPILLITAMALWQHVGFGQPVAEFRHC